MSNGLVIVESPAKAKTIKKYLGPGFEVLASYGHVRDLVPKEGAVDTEHQFAMRYQTIERNEKHLKAISQALKKADVLYLATDPDREGEAISWHLCEWLKEKDLIKAKPVYRVVFHEITERAVKAAIADPRQVSDNLVNAQQARRALDYLVGFNLSPLLWKKIRRGLSAGRVQSPALRLIAEREQEIDAFIPREYWTMEADCEKAKEPFVAKLHTYQGKKLDQFDIAATVAAHAARDALLAAAKGKLLVSRLENKERKRYPSPPFTTSTLQQEAVRKLGFTASRAMRVAQQLYEGIDLGSGPVGLISYMRTDSVSLSQDAIQDIRSLIARRFGKNNLPDAPRIYKTKSKNAQEAHEAVRPTSAAYVPEDIRSRLTDEQYKLYSLIWKRAVACQMMHATIDTVSADLACGPDSFFRATGSTVRDPGFMSVYREDFDDVKGEESAKLPPLKEGDIVDLNELRAEQHFTEPPPRYSEASLVKILEEYGIGRPSTYASIISTLQAREYVEMVNKRFQPTDIGRIVNKFLTEHFARYVDYDFTARLEDSLDEISRGEKDWLPVMEEFWADFDHLVKEKQESVSRSEITQPREIGIDPVSGKPVSVRMGRFGPFVQIGTREDEDKPRFAGLKPGQRMDSISLEEGLALFELPRVVGVTSDGEEILANVGRFGPYIKRGDLFVSLRKDDDPYTVDLDRALELIDLKLKAVEASMIKRFEEAGIDVRKGRFGPYITGGGKKNVRIPKGEEAESLTLERCQELIALAPGKKGAVKKSPAKKAAAAKPAAKKTPTKKPTVKKTGVKKAAAKKSPAKKPSVKTTHVVKARKKVSTTA